MCTAVNVVPAVAPSTLAFPAATVQNVPWNADGATGCTAASFAAGAEPAGTSVCYGFQPAQVELDVGEPYTVIGDDPEDEIYYSTCYQKKALTGFDLLPPTSPPPPVTPAPWRVGDRCLSCEDARTGPLTSYWQFADACELCSWEELDLPNSPPSPPQTAGGSSGGGNRGGDAGAGDGTGGGGSVPVAAAAVGTRSSCSPPLVDWSIGAGAVVRRRRPGLLPPTRRGTPTRRRSSRLTICTPRHLRPCAQSSRVAGPSRLTRSRTTSTITTRAPVSRPGSARMLAPPLVRWHEIGKLA